MNSEPIEDQEQVLDILSQDARVARMARMIDETDNLKPNQRKDIVERVLKFIDTHGFTQAGVARECGISKTTISDVLRLRYAGKTSDKQIIKIHNWLELAARRENMLHSREFVETSVAKEILTVASIVAETCKIGVIFGPAQIGKTFTLKAIEGQQRFGDPVLIRVNQSQLRPLPLCRAIADRFSLGGGRSFDKVFSKVVQRLVGTKRMLIFDEIERAHYMTLEMIRDLHDMTGCPVLLAGKPMIYEKLGFRHVGDFSEVTDQLAARIVCRRDLTERTRGKNPQPLFSLQDIRALITKSQLSLKVDSASVKWLQARACTLGTGGIGNAIVCLYIASKLATLRNCETITVEHLDSATGLAMGLDDAERVADVVARSSGQRRAG